MSIKVSFGVTHQYPRGTHKQTLLKSSTHDGKTEPKPFVAPSWRALSKLLLSFLVFVGIPNVPVIQPQKIQAADVTDADKKRQLAREGLLKTYLLHQLAQFDHQAALNGYKNLDNGRLEDPNLLKSYYKLGGAWTTLSASFDWPRTMAESVKRTQDYIEQGKSHADTAGQTEQLQKSLKTLVGEHQDTWTKARRRVADALVKAGFMTEKEGSEQSLAFHLAKPVDKPLPPNVERLVDFYRYSREVGQGVEKLTNQVKVNSRINQTHAVKQEFKMLAKTMVLIKENERLAQNIHDFASKTADKKEAQQLKFYMDDITRLRERYMSSVTEDPDMKKALSQIGWTAKTFQDKVARYQKAERLVSVMKDLNTLHLPSQMRVKGSVVVATPEKSWALQDNKADHIVYLRPGGSLQNQADITKQLAKLGPKDSIEVTGRLDNQYEEKAGSFSVLLRVEKITVVSGK